MELISTIINELTDVKISLTSPLLKSKVLASRIQNEQLLTWINKELTGYLFNDNVPSYRKTKGQICGDWLNGQWNATNQVIPFPDFDEETNRRIYELELTQSIQSLESLKADGKNYIAEAFDSKQRQVLEGYIRSQNPRLTLFNIYRRVPSTFVLDILSNVRDNLLNFMIQLEESYSYISEIKELRYHSSEITKIWNTTINNSGDGNLINTGDNNHIKSNIAIKKGDFESLKQYLTSQEIDNESINELIGVIDLEPPSSDGKFGILVREWVGKMITKALDGSWKISIAAAGEILITALHKYYDLK